MSRRAVLYVRLSVTQEASTSIARQEADLRERCRREGWDVVRVLADDGLSGGKRRANADEALEMLRDERADVLLVWKLDRWSRMGIGAMGDLVKVLDDRPSALFVAERDGLSSDQPAWRISAGVLSEVARMERDNTSTRTTSSIAALRRLGRYSGGTVPYGYRTAGNTEGPGRVLVLDEDEASILRECATRLLLGATPYRLATELNARGIPTRRGAPWSVQALLQMLRSDAVVGRTRHPGTTTRHTSARTGKEVTRYRRGDLVRGEDGLPVEVWPPVLALETWQRVCALLTPDEDDPRGKPQRRRRSRLLSGIVHCAHCQTPLYTKDDGRGYVVYMCPSRSRGRGDRCPGVSIGQEYLDRYVTEAFLGTYGGAEVYERRESVGQDTSTAEVESAIRATTAALGDADDDGMPALLARLASLKGRRDELRAQSHRRTVTLVPTGRTYGQDWSDAAEHMDERRALLERTYAVMMVRKGHRGRHGLDPERVRLVARPPFVADVDDDAAYRGGPVVVVDGADDAGEVWA